MQGSRHLILVGESGWENCIGNAGEKSTPLMTEKKDPAL